ncbi:MAG: serine/threonine protein kinase [Cyanobacteria bacterium]|nr:serine/threonine protein kinase [Cyanobacteriota bacterium]
MTNPILFRGRLAILGCVVAGAAVFAQRPPGPVEIAFVANAEGAEVAIVDIAARAIIGSIAVNFAEVESEGPGAPNYAQDTDVSPDGRTLYVSRGYLGDVAAFDIPSGRPLWTRPLNTMRADHMTLTRDGRQLFVSAFVDNRVYRLDTATGNITGHFVSGIFPHDIKVSKDGTRLFNSSLGQMPSFPVPPSMRPLEKPEVPVQLTIADAATLAIRDRIPMGIAMRPWQFNADETGIYALLSNQHAVVYYDLAARKVSRRLDLPVKPGVTVKDWDFEAPLHGLALTEDGSTLCLAGRGSDYAALVRAPALTLIATVPVGDGPGWAETAEDGRTCLIANTRSDDLSFVSIADRKEVRRLPIGNGPKHITVAKIPAAVVAEVKAR